MALRTMNERYFPIVMQALSASFPKTCSCGRVYTDEIDYLTSTRPTPTGTAADYQELRHLFFNGRDCLNPVPKDKDSPEAGTESHLSTLMPEIFGNFKPQDRQAFLADLKAEAKSGNVSTDIVLNKFNAQYVAWRLGNAQLTEAQIAKPAERNSHLTLENFPVGEICDSHYIFGQKGRLSTIGSRFMEVVVPLASKGNQERNLQCVFEVCTPEGREALRSVQAEHFLLVYRGVRNY